MTPDLVDLIKTLGIGGFALYLVYLTLKWLFGKVLKNLDSHTDSLKELLKDHKQFRIMFEEIIHNLKRLNGKK